MELLLSCNINEYRRGEVSSASNDEGAMKTHYKRPGLRQNRSISGRNKRRCGVSRCATKFPTLDTQFSPHASSMRRRRDLHVGNARRQICDSATQPKMSVGAKFSETLFGILVTRHRARQIQRAFVEASVDEASSSLMERDTEPVPLYNSS